MGEDYTIEHIWPQAPADLPIDNPGEYPSAEQRYEAYKHQLGNQTLASKSWNSTWGNADFETKRDEGYEKSKLWVQWDVQEYDKWSTENIERRGERLIEEYVMKKWATPKTRLTGIEDPEAAIDGLTDEEQYVLQALRENPDGAARRVIHRKASELTGSPFKNPEADREERSTVGSILSRLAGIGLAERSKSTWYPSDGTRATDTNL
jgi:hypothetical protein